MSLHIFFGNSTATGGGTSVDVTPGTATLTLTTFAPTVITSDHKSVTPGMASLTLTTFAPTVNIGVSVTPGTASLTLTTFAPTISVTNHISVTPGTAALVLTPFAPTVVTSNHQTVTPGTASLIITAFAPSIAVTDHVVVTPGTAVLTLTTFAPDVVTTQSEPTVLLYGGDDAPRKRKRRKRNEDFYRDLEHTIHALLHPSQEDVPSDVPVLMESAKTSYDRQLEDLLVLAKSSHESLRALGQIKRQVEAIAKEKHDADLDEEDALIMMF